MVWVASGSKIGLGGGGLVPYFLFYSAVFRLSSSFKISRNLSVCAWGSKGPPDSGGGGRELILCSSLKFLVCLGLRSVGGAEAPKQLRQDFVFKNDQGRAT